MRTDSSPAENTGRCSIGLTSEALSTWLADGLDESCAQRVREHITTCAECQAHVAAYTKIDNALRNQPVPQSADAAWSRLQPRLRHAGHSGPAHDERSGWHSVARGIAALAAILLLVVSFFQLFHGRSPNMTALGKLTWRAVIMPSGSVLATGHNLAVPANDGNTAYVCSMTASGEVASIWRTHDRAAHWTKSHALPDVGHAVDSCAIIVDDYQPSIALVVVSWAQPSALPRTPDTSASFVTTDGGGSWRLAGDSKSLGIAWLATVNGRTYGLLNVGCNASLPTTRANDCLWHVYAISDTWQTWQMIDQIPTQHSEPIGARGFWIDPSSGAILEATLNKGTSYSGLWKTTDGGTHWQRVDAPMANGFSGHVSADGRSLLICGSSYAGTDYQNPQNWPFKLSCSSDDGATWHDRPMLTLPPGNATSMIPRIITTDGTILQVVTDGKTQTLYRLTATGTRWQPVGQLARAKGVYVIFGAGALWEFSLPMLESSPVLPLKGNVFVAAYP